MKDKRKAKLDKHFDILIENRKVSVLSYKISNKDGNNILALKTMVKSELIPRLIGKSVQISIPAEDASINVVGECYVFAHFPPLYEIGFKIPNWES